MPESKLEAARKTGSLANVIGALREEHENTQQSTASGREEVNEVDGAIRLASHLAEMGTKKGAERREAMKDVRIGVTVGAKGVVKTRLTQAEQLAKVLSWSKTLTEAQRHAFITGEKFEELSEHAQGLVADAFGTVDAEELVLEDTVGESFDVATYDLDAELADVDAIAGDEDDDETDESYVDPVDEAYLNGETYYYTGEEG
jgi:hypothetical protein